MPSNRTNAQKALVAQLNAELGTSHACPKLRREASVMIGQLIEQSRAAKKAEWAAEAAKRTAGAPPAVQGRTQIEGSVVTSKEVHGMYGTTRKLLLEAEDGNRYYCTMPKSIVDEVENQVSYVTDRHFQGLILAVEAAWVRSADDEHFATGKRPTGAVIAVPDDSYLAETLAATLAEASS